MWSDVQEWLIFVKSSGSGVEWSEGRGWKGGRMGVGRNAWISQERFQRQSDYYKTIMPGEKALNNTLFF